MVIWCNFSIQGIKFWRLIFFWEKCLAENDRLNFHWAMLMSIERFFSPPNPNTRCNTEGPFRCVWCSARAGHDESGSGHEEGPNEDGRVEAGAERAQCLGQPVGAHRPVARAHQLLLLQVVEQRRVVSRVDGEVLALALSHPPRTAFPVIIIINF